MAKKSFKVPNYKKAVARNTEKELSEGNNYGYLKIPRGVDLLKERKGRIYLDIIPYPITNKHHADIDVEAGIEVGVVWYKLPFKVHRNIGAGESQTVVCPTTFGKPCPICEYRNKRAKEGADKDELKALNTSNRVLYAVIPRKDKEMEEKFHLWNTSHFFVQDMINKELEEDEALYSFPDLEDGYRLNIRFDEESFAGNKYFRPSRIDFDERDPLDEDLLDSVPKLDECLNILSYAELTALLYQIDPGDIEDDDEIKEEKPRRKRKTVEVVGEDDDDAEIEEIPEIEGAEEEEEEEEKPKKRKTKAQTKKTKATPVIEEEDDEDDDEDEDSEIEEEQPKPKKKPKKKASGECPYGHNFGDDNDKFPKDCNKCEVWDDCYDSYFEND